MKTFLIFVLSFSTILSQQYEIEKVKGNVKYISSADNTWQNLKSKVLVNQTTLISTDKNSSVKIKRDDIVFVLNESAAVSLSGLKKMSTDDLLLALALEDILDAPKQNKKSKSDNTAVYGDKITKEVLLSLESIEFGEKRLNGAVQLSRSGFIESAIVTAKEVYRKYPETKNNIETRLYFANLLKEKGLYEESLKEYNEIAGFNLSEEQRNAVKSQINLINKKLLNN